MIGISLALTQTSLTQGASASTNSLELEDDITSIQLEDDATVIDLE